MATKPKLAMIPSGYKGQTATPPKLYSVLPADGTGDFTFDRNLNTATRINKDGLIEMVDADVPRLNYPLIDGVVSGCPSLLLEPSRTNLVTNSNDFTSWANSGSYITADYGISPDGTLNASRCLFTNTNQTIAKVIGTNGTLSYSIYLKGVKGETINISMASGSDESFTLNGEWQRLSYSDTVTNATININTFGGKTARDLLIFGSQLEAGSYATSYIPTSGQPITRSAETANGAGDASTFNDSEGVLMAEISALANDGTERRLSLQDNGTYNAVRITFTPTANSLTAVVYNNGANQFNAVHILNDATTFNKIAIKYKQNDFALWVNGIEVATDTNGSVFSEGSLDKLSYELNGIAKVYAKTKQLQYFDTALTDAELEKLTSYDSFRDMAIAGQYKTY